ncbi:MAG TPA: hypothetical protein VHV32_06145, partial [Candidatus Angelobacter sp.]|nr:hypothetical protein [Candidatus Angelobacter sp.]
MMVSLKVAERYRRTLGPAPALRKVVKPPALKLLPRRTYTKSMLLSAAFHAAAILALIWLPTLFPGPVIMDAYHRKNPAVASAYEPLILPLLPKLLASASGSSGQAKAAPPTPSSPAPDTASLKRDYAGRQEIISDFPNAVNRVQTIRRPDLVSLPELKFPLRLQSVVILPAAAAPKFNLRRIEVQIPIAEPTVEMPKLVSVPQPLPTTPGQTVPSNAAVQPKSMNSPIIDLQNNARKAVIVVNAVNVAPDLSVQIPDAQLSGSFVVGPSPGKAAPGKSSTEGNGRSAESDPAKSGASVSQPSKGSTAGSDSTGEVGKNSSPAIDAGSANTAKTETGLTSGNGAGSGTGPSVPGNGNAGLSGRSPAKSGTGGISISGGSSGRNGGIGSRSVPMSRTYGLTIISGGSSGGAGRDTGVFDRSETVFSVAIPMSDAGGGPDWPMQYSLKNHAQSGAGMLVPPFAQKKVAANMSRAQLA